MTMELCFKNSVNESSLVNEGIKGNSGCCKTPKQNGVAKRKNRTLIEVARTKKPHNKTPYELICGRTPLIYFMKPFGCHVTILNTRDHLGLKDYEEDSGMKPTEEDVSGALDKDGEDDQATRSEFERLLQQEKQTVHPNSTNSINTISTPVKKRNILFERFSPLKNAFILPPVSNVTLMDDTGIFGNAYDDEDVGADADLKNLETTINVSHISTTRIDKDHPKDQIIGDFNSAIQTRRMTKIFDEHAMIEAMQEELLQFQLQKVWTLVNLPNGKSVIGTKWVYRNKKNKRGIVDRKESVILAYTSFMGFIVYQMDVKSAFLYDTIKEEVYVCQPPSFEDPQFPDKVYKVEKALYGLHQAPKAWYKTLSTYLIENGFRRGTIDKIFSSEGHSQEKYVAEILKKFDFAIVKTTSTPMEPNKALVKDEEAEAVDVYLYRSMIGSLMVEKLEGVWGFWCLLFELRRGASNGRAAERVLMIALLTNAKIFKQLAFISYKKTAWEQFSSNIATAIICLATNKTFNFSKLIFEAMVKNLDNKGRFDDTHVSDQPKEQLGVFSAAKRLKSNILHKYQQRIKASVMQSENYSEEDLPRKLVELFNQSKKLFAQQRPEAKRNKPMNPTQQKAYMSTYIKNQEGGSVLCGHSGEFGWSYRDGGETKRQKIREASGLVQEQSDERQKIGEASGLEDMPKTKDWRSIRDDLVKLWSLVYERFNSTELTHDKAKQLWVELKRLFEPDENDTLWKIQRYMHDLLTWKLYDTCGVHHVSTERGLDIFMLDDEGGINDQERTKNSAQDVNTVGPNLTAPLEPTYADIFGDESELDLSNIATTYPVPTTPNTRIHKDHSLDHVLGDVQSGRAQEDNPSIKISKLNRNYARRASAIQITTRLDTGGFTLWREGYWKKMVYQTRKMREMDVNSALLYDKIEEEVYVCQLLGFEDLEFPDKAYKVEKALYGLHQASRACSIGELTFFLGLQVTQKDDGIFINQDKYVDEILKNFGFSTVKIASTPMKTSKRLLKDTEDEDVDVLLI
ncbi:putative ribonuclease H-like domain-containing protein [Tanacetum coccineum]